MSYAHRVCFGCRKSWSMTFKRWRGCRIESNHPDVCPDCKHPLLELGRFFKPPKQSNIKQWCKVEAMVQAGFNFTCAAMPTPETLAQVPMFSDVMRRLRQPKGKWLAEKFKK